MLSAAGFSVVRATLCAMVASSFIFASATPQYRVQVSLFFMANLQVLMYSLLVFSAMLMGFGPTGQWGNVLFFLFPFRNKTDATSAPPTETAEEFKKRIINKMKSRTNLVRRSGGRGKKGRRDSAFD